MAYEKSRSKTPFGAIRMRIVSMSKKSIETLARLVVFNTTPFVFGRVTLVTFPIDLKDADAGLEIKQMQKRMKRNEDNLFILTYGARGE